MFTGTMTFSPGVRWSSGGKLKLGSGPVGKIARPLGTSGICGRGVPDKYELIKVTDGDFDLAFRVGDGAKVSGVTIAANPDWRPFRQMLGALRLQPFIKAYGVAAHIGVRRARHFKITPRRQ